MRRSGRRVWLAAALAACLLLAGCEEAEPSAGEEAGIPVTALDYEPFPELELPGGEVAVSARFRSESGTALSGGEASLTVSDTRASFSLDETGEIRVSGLPREGTVDLTLYDGRDREKGHTTIHFSTGAVIDASTDDETGDGYVTTRADTEAVALQFTLGASGLRCALRLDG